MFRLLMLAAPLVLLACNDRATPGAADTPPTVEAYRTALSQAAQRGGDTGPAKAMAAVFAARPAGPNGARPDSASPDSARRNSEGSQEPAPAIVRTPGATCDAPLEAAAKRIRERLLSVQALVNPTDGACSAVCKPDQCERMGEARKAVGRARAHAASLADRLAVLSLAESHADEAALERLHRSVRRGAAQVAAVTLALAEDMAAGNPSDGFARAPALSATMHDLAADAALLAWEDRLTGSTATLVNALENAGHALARIAAYRPEGGTLPVPQALAASLAEDLAQAGENAIAAFGLLDAMARTMPAPTGSERDEPSSKDGSTAPDAKTLGTEITARGDGARTRCLARLSSEVAALGPVLEALAMRLKTCPSASTCKSRIPLGVDMLSLAAQPVTALVTELDTDSGALTDHLTALSSLPCE